MRGSSIDRALVKDIAVKLKEDLLLVIPVSRGEGPQQRGNIVGLSIGVFELLPSDVIQSL